MTSQLPVLKATQVQIALFYIEYSFDALVMAVP